MAMLQLLSLVCHRTEDWTGTDEPYILLNGQRVWGPESMNDNDVENLSRLSIHRFNKKVRIDLYDQDSGGLDDDDYLGRTYARALKAGKGEQEHNFRGDGAHYTLTYKVLRENGSSAPAVNKYKLKLFSLVCHRTEDWTGADEPYILLNGQRVWGPESMNDNDVENLSRLSIHRFNKKVRIDLYEQDSGGLDDDDHLGFTYARASQAGKGELEHNFRGDGAHYTLTYEVVAV